MIYSTPAEIQSYLITIKPGDYHLAIYPSGNMRLRRCDTIYHYEIEGTNIEPANNGTFGYEIDARSHRISCTATLIIPNVTTIKQAKQLHPEAFL